jgi:hypothetical protein
VSVLLRRQWRRLIVPPVDTFASDSDEALAARVDPWIEADAVLAMDEPAPEVDGTVPSIFDAARPHVGHSSEEEGAEDGTAE